MAKIKKTYATKFWRGTHILLLGMQNDTATLEMLGQFLIKLNILLPYDPEIVLNGNYP